MSSNNATEPRFGESAERRQHGTKRDEEIFTTVIGTRKLGFLTIPVENGCGAKVQHHTAKTLRQSIPFGTHLIQLDGHPIEHLRHDAIMNLITETLAKGPIRISFRKPNKRKGKSKNRFERYNSEDPSYGFQGNYKKAVPSSAPEHMSCRTNYTSDRNSNSRTLKYPKRAFQGQQRKTPKPLEDAHNPLERPMDTDLYPTRYVYNGEHGRPSSDYFPGPDSLKYSDSAIIGRLMEFDPYSHEYESYSQIHFHDQNPIHFHDPTPFSFFEDKQYSPTIRDRGSYGECHTLKTHRRDPTYQPKSQRTWIPIVDQPESSCDSPDSNDGFDSSSASFSSNDHLEQKTFTRSQDPQRMFGHIVN